MNKLNFIILFSCCLLMVGTNAFCKEDVLAVITNDDNSDVYKFIASTDDDTNALKSFYKDGYSNGVKSDREILSTSALVNNGVILDQEGSHAVIVLKSDNFDETNGGSVTIDTLYNAVSGERRKYQVDLVHEDDSWKLQNNNSTVSNIHIEANKKMILGTVGIKNIRMD